MSVLETTHFDSADDSLLTRFAHEPNIMNYIKIVAMLPNRTITYVTLGLQLYDDI
jgi:hypothetical protein